MHGNRSHNTFEKVKRVTEHANWLDYVESIARVEQVQSEGPQVHEKWSRSILLKGVCGRRDKRTAYPGKNTRIPCGFGRPAGATETRKFEGWTPMGKGGSDYETEFDSK